MRIIDRLDARANELGLSDNELYRRAGIPTGSFSHARKSPRGHISPENLEKLAPVLQTTVAALMGLETGEPGSPASSGGGQIVYFPLDRLGLSPVNERSSVSDDETKDMAESILAKGLLQNLIVYPHPSIADFHLVAGGGRRWRGLNWLSDRGQLPDLLRDHGIPCRLCRDEDQALVLTVTENLKRKDVHFLDRAAGYARMRDRLGWDATTISQEVGVGNDSVTQYLRVHDRLSPSQRDAAWRGEINFKQARELVAERKETAPETTAKNTMLADRPQQVQPAPSPSVPQEPSHHKLATTKRDGEVSWPYGWGCMGHAYQGGRLIRLALVDRLTGRQQVFIPEQPGGGDDPSNVQARVNKVLNAAMGADESSPIDPNASLLFDLKLGSGDAVHIGQALAVEFGFPTPPYIADPDDDTGFPELGFNTVGDLVAFLKKRLAHAGAGTAG